MTEYRRDSGRRFPGMRCVSCGREDLRVVFLEKIGSVTRTYCNRCEHERSEPVHEQEVSASS